MEANYFTAPQQQLIHDFADRRGGGVLFLGGRASPDRWRLAELAAGGPVPDAVCPTASGTFHRDFTGAGADRRRARERHLPPGRRSRRATPSAGRRCRSWRITRKSAKPSRAPPRCCESTPAGQARAAAAGHRELRPRPHRAVRHRRKLALEDVAGPRRQDARDVLAADVALPGDRHAGPGDRRPRRSRCSPTRPSVPIRVEVRDKQYKPVTNAKVQAHFLRPDGTSATMELAPRAARRRHLRRRLDRREARLVRGRDSSPGSEQRRDRPRRADLPPRGRRGREFPHLAESRTAGETVASRPAAGTTRRPTRPSWRTRSPIRRRESRRARPGICGTCRSSSCWRWASAPPNGCCAGSGVWYEERDLGTRA